MKLSHIIAAAGLAIAAGGAAQAQPMHDHGMMHQHTVVTTRHTEVVRHGGMGFRHQRCHMEYHHHHRVRVCR